MKTKKGRTPKISALAESHMKQLRAGSGMTLRADEFTSPEIVELAKAARDGKVQILFRGFLSRPDRPEIFEALREAGASSNIAF